MKQSALLLRILIKQKHSDLRIFVNTTLALGIASLCLSGIMIARYVPEENNYQLASLIPPILAFGLIAVLFMGIILFFIKMDISTDLAILKEHTDSDGFLSETIKTEKRLKGFIS